MPVTAWLFCGEIPTFNRRHQIAPCVSILLFLLIIMRGFVSLVCSLTKLENVLGTDNPWLSLMSYAAQPNLASGALRICAESHNLGS